MNTHPLKMIEWLIGIQLRQQSYMLKFFIPDLKMHLHTLLWEPLNLIELERDENQLATHVQLYQRSLLRLMDIVANNLSEEEQQHLEELNPDYELQDCCKVIFSCLRKCLVAMDRDYGHHMHIDYQVPSFYLELMDDDVKVNLRLIRDKLSDAKIDDGYWTILRKPLNDLLSTNGSPKKPYMELEYLKSLYDELIRLLKVENKNLHGRLQEIFLYLNFNDPHYCSYAIELMTRELDSVSATKDKLMKLAYMRKVVHQASCRPGAAYIPSEPPLQPRLEHWIKEQHAAVERQSKDLSGFPPEIIQLFESKIDMQMSARQLNDFVKVIVDKDFYKENKRDVEDLFSQFFKTLPEDNPAADKALRKFKWGLKFRRFISGRWS